MEKSAVESVTSSGKGSKMSCSKTTVALVPALRKGTKVPDSTLEDVEPRRYTDRVSSYVVRSSKLKGLACGGPPMEKQRGGGVNMCEDTRADLIHACLHFQCKHMRNAIFITADGPLR